MHVPSDDGSGPFQGVSTHTGPGPLGEPAGENAKQEGKLEHKVMRRGHPASCSPTAAKVTDRPVPRADPPPLHAAGPQHFRTQESTRVTFETSGKARMEVPLPFREGPCQRFNGIRGLLHFSKKVVSKRKQV